MTWKNEKVYIVNVIYSEVSYGPLFILGNRI